jgi:hypothetical protein
MTSEVVNLEVTASIPIDCDFWISGLKILVGKG